MSIVDASLPGDDEDLSVPIVEIDPDVLDKLIKAGQRYRDEISVVVAAYQIAENRLDAVIWAARRAGASYRSIAEALELRTAMVRARGDEIEKLVNRSS